MSCRDRRSCGTQLCFCLILRHVEPKRSQVVGDESNEGVSAIWTEGRRWVRSTNVHNFDLGIFETLFNACTS